MARKKKISKRQKVFNVISNTIDIVQEYYLRGMFLLFLMVYVYVVYMFACVYIYIYIYNIIYIYKLLYAVSACSLVL